MATHDADSEQDWRYFVRRRLTYIVLLIIAVALAGWFIHWLSNGIGMNRIGDHYKQAEDY